MLLDERLNTFLTVVRCGSLSRAARELHLSQPAVSLQIQRLEEEYDAVFFHRRERGVELTTAGRVLLEYARRMQDLSGRLADEIAAMNENVRGTLRVGATLTIGEYVLPPIMGQFKARYPEVDILLEVENTRKVVERVAAGQSDCGLVEGPFENGLILAERLGGDELTLVVSAQHRWAEVRQVTLENLVEENFILREPGSGTRQVFEDALSRAGIEASSLKILIQLGSTQAIKALVRENLGVTVISDRVVWDEIKSGVLKKVNVPELHLKRDFNFISRKNQRLSFIATRFLQVCRLQIIASHLDPAAS